jgi:hypothetical protein
VAEYRKERRRVEAGEREGCEPHVFLKIRNVRLEISRCECLACFNDKVSGVMGQTGVFCQGEYTEVSSIVDPAPFHQRGNGWQCSGTRHMQALVDDTSRRAEKRPAR